MYELVNDIEAYPSFLPWCVDARILEKAEHKLTATVSLAAGKIKQSFTTENTMQKYQRIDVKLVTGPFKYLNGSWRFDAENNCCHISIDMEFEFSNKLMKLALDRIFSHIINTLIETFTQRAHQVYGGS